MTDDARDLTLWRFDGAAASARADQVAHEEPL